MKNIIFLLVALLITACGSKNDDPKPVNKLIGTWKIESISRDDVSYNEFYQNFRLTIKAASYSITGRPELSPFMPNGTVNTETKQLLQADALAFDYNLISDSELSITFTYTGSGYVGGRVAGNWKVVLLKQQ